MNETFKSKVLIPMPNTGFDPTEVAIPWYYLTQRGHKVVFATPNSKKGISDHLILSGNGLGLFSIILRANQQARIQHSTMIKSREFCKPLSYENIDYKNFDGIILPGGHEKRGVRKYLESKVL
ncbi:MAG: type 1 glutamine amidotransferase domain-containing protein [Oligoflexales bacterium]